MNGRGVLNAIGALIAFVGVSMLAPLLVALHYREAADVRAFAIAMGITVATGAALFAFTRGTRDLGIRDGFGVVVFGWSAMTLFGALPFLLAGTCTHFVDAVFETMSGFTTTGATILVDIEAHGRGILFWRSLTQWIGGMGIIVLSLAILPMLGVGGMQLYRAEAPGPTPDKLTPRIRQTAAYLWVVYAVVSAAEAVALFFCGMSWYDAVCHTFTTMATGGFSTRNASVAAFDSALIDGVITFFMFVAGSNFALHYRAWRHPRAYLEDPEWRFFTILLAIAIVATTATLWISADYDLAAAMRSAAFQVLSITTTTGFATDDYEKWAPALRWLMLLLMLVGGCAGSTAGAVKVVRHMILVKAGLGELAVVANPRVVRPVTLGRRRVDPEVVRNVLGFAVLYMGILLLGTLALSASGFDLETALSSAATCLGNVGPGLGLVGPTENFAWMGAAPKWLLTFLMLLGRLEVYTVLALFLPQTWKR
ncbi:TrkH family potassium uptake protein [bacterium]|nr:TrkH family potassium uptake protein [bacterium]